MLMRTEQGVRVVADWSPTRIGQAYLPAPPRQGEGMDWIQAGLLKRKPLANLTPIKVPVLDTVERLVDFLNG